MYRALYRKWRPAAFSDVVGQEGVTTALKNQLLHDKVGHAYIFTGTRGTGKTTCAKIFAKAVNCPNRTGADPCNQCAVCKGIDDGSVMDVVEIDAASNNGVDNIRDLRDETAYIPSQGKYKVYIIDEVHMLSTAAFNALLKIMEEPPSHVIFILATTEIHKVPATILSRCQRYDFTRIRAQDIAQRLLYVSGEENIRLSEGAAGLIARLADGAMRDALSILDTCAGVSEDVDEALVRKMAGVTDKSYLFDLSQALSEGDAPAALALIARLREQSIDVKRLCDEMILHYRNLLLAGVPGAKDLLSGVSAEEEARYTQAAAGVPQQQAVRAIRTLCEALEKMGRGTDARIELELAVFRLCQPEDARPAPAATGAQPQPPARTVQPFAQAAVPASQPAPPPAEAPAPTAQDTQDAPPWAGPATPPPPVPAAERPAPSPAPAQQQSAPQPAPARPQRQSAAEKAAPPQPLPEGKEEVPFEPWPQVVAAMEQRDKLLYASMKGTKAYYDGRRVLIDGSELFLKYMRQNAYSNGLLKDVIAEVTGARYAIGPHKKKTAGSEEPAQLTADDTLRHLSDAGVDVVYINEE